MTVTVPEPVNAVHGAQRQRESKCRGIDTDLELSRAAGIQALSHGLSRSFSEISDRVGCEAGPIVTGGVKSVVRGEQMAAQ
jgi:hypothetical protein